MPNFWPWSRQEDESYLKDSRLQDVCQSATETERHVCCRASGPRLDIRLCFRRHVCVTHGHHPRHGSFASRDRETRLRCATVQKLSQRDPRIPEREEKIDFSYDRMEIWRQDMVVVIFFIVGSTHVFYGLREQGLWLCHGHSNSSHRFSRLI